jgi:hypothetical protein
LEFLYLDSLEAVWLEKLFQEVEVFQALLSIDEDKASGPNGLTIAFYHSCWSIVKAGLRSFFHNFHEHERFEKGLNATFIALIPNKVG